jgi:hypothetical protein
LRTLGKSAPARIAAQIFQLGKICRTRQTLPGGWANTSTFQKSNAQKNQQNQGKYWFTAIQGSVNKSYRQGTRQAFTQTKGATLSHRPFR